MCQSLMSRALRMQVSAVVFKPMEQSVGCPQDKLLACYESEPSSVSASVMQLWCGRLGTQWTSKSLSMTALLTD